jgi:hypothetical protein
MEQEIGENNAKCERHVTYMHMSQVRDERARLVACTEVNLSMSLSESTLLLVRLLLDGRGKARKASAREVLVPGSNRAYVVVHVVAPGDSTGAELEVRIVVEVACRVVAHALLLGLGLRQRVDVDGVGAAALGRLDRFDAVNQVRGVSCGAANAANTGT